MRSRVPSTARHAGRHLRRSALLALLLAGLVAAPGHGAAVRADADAACALPTYLRVVHLGMAHALPASAALAPDAPVPLGRVDAPAHPIQPPGIAPERPKARAPPLRSIA